MGSAGCLTANAEYLTPNGWKKFKDYEDGDLVAQYNQYTDSVEFVLPEQFIKLPCKSFRRIVGNGLSFTLSDEHKVPYWENKSDKLPVLKTWNEVLNIHSDNEKGFKGYIKTSFKYDGKGIDLNEGELRLQIAVQADGRIVKEGLNNYTQMRFAKKRKYDRLKWILDTWNLPYKDNGSVPSDRYLSGKFYEIIVYPKYRDKTFDSKYYNATKEQLEIIKDEVGYWDGKIYDWGLIRYSTTNKANADFIQFVFHATGHNTSYTIDDRVSIRPNSSICYQVDCSSKIDGFRQFTNLNGKKRPIEFVESPDGYKYCFTMPKGMFLVRENNWLFITHNSGKSYNSLLRFLRYINEPRYVGYIIRKTQASIRFGLFETAIMLFTTWDKRVKINRNEMSFTFPSGCKIICKGLDGTASIQYFQGQEISGVLVDEATHISYEEFSWLLTRLRNRDPNSKVKPTAWLTCNPDPDHFLLNFVEWYLYPKKTYIEENGHLIDVGGRVNPERNGKVRWFYTIDGSFYWADSKEELKEKYKDLVQDVQQPMSFRFIGATYRDNPKLDPRYVSNLLNKTRLEREILVNGNWYARLETAGYWRHEWCQKIKHFPHADDPDDKIVKRVRAWDLAYTEPHEGNPDPDYTASVLMSKTKNGFYVVEHITRTRVRIGALYRHICDVAQKDYEMYGIVPQILPEDPSSGKVTFQFAKKYLIENGIVSVGKANATGKTRSKLERFKNFAAASENGAVMILEGEWNDIYFHELEAFDGTRNCGKDD